MATKTNLAPIELEEEGLSFTELFLIFWRKRVLITVFALVGAVVGATTSVILNATSTRVSTLVEYQWDGINVGEYPNGTNFDVSNAFTTNVLNNALSDAELVIETNRLRNALQIVPIVPNNILAAIESARQRGETFIYYPTAFKYTLNASSLGLTATNGSLLLDAIINNFAQDFLSKYVNQTVVQNFAFQSITDFEDLYDYLDRVTILSNQTRIVRDLLNELVKNEPRAKTFRSSNLNLTFNDILAQISLIDQLQIRYIEGLIVNNLITNNPNTIIDRLQYANLLNTLELGKKQSFLNELLLLVANYDGSTSTVIIPGYEGVINTTNVLNAIYERIVETQEEIADLQQQIQYNLTLIQLYQNSSGDSPEFTALKASVNTELNVIYLGVQRLVNNTNALLSEYNQLAAKNVVKTLIPATTVQGTGLLIPTAIGLFAASILGAIIVFSQYSGKVYQLKKTRA
jgi:hypothetical protein